MSNLEDIIRQHKYLADNKEPAPGHFLRFFRKSGCVSIYNKGFHIKFYYMIAAASILAAVLITGIISDKNIRYGKAGIPEDISEVIYYYDSISENLIKMIKGLKDTDSSEITGINTDIQTSEKWRSELLGDYRKFPDDERVVNAIIEFYKNKAEMLNDIYIQISGENNIIL